MQQHRIGLTLGVYLLALAACSTTEQPNKAMRAASLAAEEQGKRVGHIQADGSQLYYEDVGQGPVVILVHGSSGHSAHWEQQVPALVDAGFRCITFDLRSFGRSKSEPDQGNQSTIAADIEQIRRTLKLGKVFVVGQSHGAEGALEYGLDYAEHSMGIVIASTWRGAEDEPAYAKLRASMAPSEQQIANTPRIEIQFSADYRDSNPAGLQRFQHINEAYPRNGISGSTSLRDSVQKTRAPSDYARLSKMWVPVLVLSGEKDIITSPGLMQALANHIPGSRYATIPAAGRYAFWENPATYNRAVIEFLRTTTGQSRR